MSLIEGKVNFYQGANDTPESSAEKTQETYEGLKDLEASIKANVYTNEKANNQNNKDRYRLKASSINFLEIQEKTLTTKEYGNSEFDHMLKNALIIQGNKNKAGEKYNEITGGNYASDSIGTIFNNLITFMKSKGLERPKDRTGAYTNADFLYMVGLGQALVIREKKEERKDYSANKVSTNFGDYMLGFNSMNDFESMNFQPAIDILQTKEELENLKNEIYENDKKENENKETQQITEEELQKREEEITAENEINQELNNIENNIQQSEIVAETRAYPKTKDIYQEGTEEYFFTQKDVENRGIANTEYLPMMYASLNIGTDLQGIETKDELKEFVGLLLKQTDKVISQLKTGIDIESVYPIEDVQYGQGYVFEKLSEESGKYKVNIRFNKEGMEKIFDPENQEGEFGRFSKTVKINGKEEEIIINTRTPEMIKAYNTSVIQGRPIGNKQGEIKEKFIFDPVGISIQKIYADKGEKVKIGTITTGDQELFKNRDFESVAQK